MAHNFLSSNRDQPMLLPPDLRDWLDEGHLAWFVIEAIEELDLDAFYSSYRSDGHGRAAHDPKMMLTLLAYAYCVGERSSRGIERRCREDVAFRVITANQAPDHATIARFRVRHERAVADLFGQVLGLCAGAGLVEVGVIAVDGSKFAAMASDRATRSYEQIAEEIKPSGALRRALQASDPRRPVLRSSGGSPSENAGHGRRARSPASRRIARTRRTEDPPLALHAVVLPPSRSWVGAAGDRVAGGAMGADQVVVGSHHRGEADDRRLLAGGGNSRPRR